MNFLSAVKNFIFPPNFVDQRVESLQNELIKVRRETYNMMGVGTHYDAAKKNRLTYNWDTSTGTFSENIKTELRPMIARALNMYDNNVMVRSLVETKVSNVINTGITVRSNVKDEKDKPIASVNKELDSLWKLYIKDWSSEGDISYSDAQAIRYREMLICGSTFTNVVPSNDKKSLLPIKNQLMNVLRLDEVKDDFVPNLQDSKNISRTIFGINFDKYSRAISYNITGINTPIPVDTLQLHYFKKYAEQFIGLPDYSPAMKYFWGLDQLFADKIVASKIQAKIALWMPKNLANDMFSNDTNSDGTVSWEGGSVVSGQTGEKPEVIQADDSISTILEPLNRMIQHATSASSGLSYQATTRDLNQASMASARVNVNEDRRTYRRDQKLFSEKVLKYDWKVFIDWVMKSNRVSGEATALWLTKPYLFYSPTYQAPGFDRIDPKAEITSEVELINNQLKTRRRYHEERNEVYEDELEQLQKENKDFEGFQPKEEDDSDSTKQKDKDTKKDEKK